MQFLSKIKEWFATKAPQEFVEEESCVLLEEDLSNEKNTIAQGATLELSEEEQQFNQIKQFVASDDISNHELAAMFMAGLGTKWDKEMYEMVAESADKMTFWAQQEDNQHFLDYYTKLIITPQFFSQYSEIAGFAEILPCFEAIEELHWKAKHYWNQHPILVAASQLPNIKRLYVENCRMNFLPESLCEATSLEELYLSNNKLTEIPDSFEQLLNLRVLDLNENDLQRCPRPICGLKKLEKLHLDNNPLREIEPRMLGRLYRLRDLQLPDKLAKTNLSALKDWLPDVNFDKPYWQFD